MSSDRNLLFGVLALQMDFVSRDALIAAMQAWLSEKEKPLGEILRERGNLTPARLRMLNQLVDEHVELHQGDVQQSLAAVSASSWLKQQLKSLCDPELQAALVSLGAARQETDPYATPSYLPAPSDGVRYRVLRPHAKGGLGEVFVAEDTELHREVALKEIQERHADNPDSRGRFVLEAEVTGGLEHPNIVPVYGLGHYADGRPYYAMRFIRGDSLKDAIERFHRSDSLSPLRGEKFSLLAFRKLLGRFVDVCNAIAYAHSRGVLHRDLKPGNIMLGKYGETLVVDWGLAKPLGRTEPREQPDRDERTLHPASGSSVIETLAGTAVGTPAFMSPEQAAGRLDELGPASDVYSLGATLYVLLTGQAPFKGDAGEVLKRSSSRRLPCAKHSSRGRAAGT